MPGESTYFKDIYRARNRALGVNLQVQQRIRASFERALAEIASSQAEGVLTAARSKQLRQQIARLLDDFNGVFNDAVANGTALTIDDLIVTHDRALLKLEKLTGQKIARSFDTISDHTYRNLALRRGVADFQSILPYHLKGQALPQLDAFLAQAQMRGLAANRVAGDIAKTLAMNDPTLLQEALKVPEGLRALQTGGLGRVDWTAYGIAPGNVAAVRSLFYNARRIAVSEINNTLREANTEAMLSSPVVEGAKWQTSSRHTTVDECDVLAEADLYDMGPGYYPPEFWPVAPHPHCGCYQGGPMKFRPVNQWGKPRPAPPKRVQNMNPLGQYDRWRQKGNWTHARTQRARDTITTVVRQAEDSYAMRKASGRLLPRLGSPVDPKQVALNALTTANANFEKAKVQYGYGSPEYNAAFKKKIQAQNAAKKVGIDIKKAAVPKVKVPPTPKPPKPKPAAPVPTKAAQIKQWEFELEQGYKATGMVHPNSPAYQTGLDAIAKSLDELEKLGVKVDRVPYLQALVKKINNGLYSLPYGSPQYKKGVNQIKKYKAEIKALQDAKVAASPIAPQPSKPSKIPGIPHPDDIKHTTDIDLLKASEQVMSTKKYQYPYGSPEYKQAEAAWIKIKGMLDDAIAKQTPAVPMPAPVPKATPSRSGFLVSDLATTSTDPFIDDFVKFANRQKNQLFGNLRKAMGDFLKAFREGGPNGPVSERARNFLSLVQNWQRGGHSGIREMLQEYIKTGSVSRRGYEAVKDLMEMIATSNPSDAPAKLYRGMQINKSKKEVLDFFAENRDNYDLGISSFSRSAQQAAKFGGKYGSSSHVTNVRLVVQGQKKAINIQAFAQNSVYHKEQEWIMGGRFRVVKVEVLRKGEREMVEVTLEQLAAFAP